MEYMTRTVLIVEDDARIAQWVKVYFEKAGFSAQIESDGRKGLSTAKSFPPDLIILDLMLPNLDGMAFCQQFREHHDTPIIMLTARDGNQEKISGLNLGADDYVTKPFDPDELIARANALLRRSQHQVQKILSCPPFTLNLAEQTASLNDEAIELGHAQFKLLEVFARHPNQVLSRDQLIQLAFGKEYDGFDRAIDNHISRLRKAVNIKGNKPIQTVYGAGYKLVSNPNVHS